MELPIRDDTILAIVLNPREDVVGYDIGIQLSEIELAKDGLYTYISEGFEQKDPMAITLMEIFITVAEGMKNNYPELAASVRKSNLEYFKSKQNESPSSDHGDIPKF